MKTQRKRISKALVTGIVGTTLACPISLRAEVDPEAGTVQTDTKGKPYYISKGDTLSQIAESLYGNWIKFKDLWELNKDRIANPNLIYPGQRLRLIDGDEIELVEGASGRVAKSKEDAASDLVDEGELVADNGSTPLPSRSVRGNGKQGRRGRSNEWQLLPKQSWETFTFRIPPQIDPDGFDRRSRVGIKYKDTINLPASVSTDRLAVMGEITGGRTEYGYFGIGEQVLIRAEEELQVGQTYSLSREPEKLQSHRDARVGYLYRLSGKVRIVGVRDGVFVGTITQAYEPVQRSQILVAEIPQIRLVDAVPAPSALAASLIEDESDLSTNLGGHRMIFLDVGTEDGVKPGMVFRRYQHEDPMTGKTLSSQDFLVDAEVKVLQAGDRFSAAIVLNNRAALLRDDELVAVVDVSDLGKHLGLQSDLQDTPTGNLDELDRMDPSQGLGEQEDRELRQLEAEGSSEIQRVEVNSSNRAAVEIGKEKGPNDHSGGAGSQRSAPPVPGDTQNAPTDTPVPDDSRPGTEPAPEAPPVDEVQPEAPLPTTAPDPTEPGAPAPSPAPPASDPFATDSFQDSSGTAVEPAPVTEGNPNPPGDPLLDAIPEGGGTEVPPQ